MSTALDYPALIRTALNALGLPPSETWALSPGELASLLTPASASAQPLTRPALNSLIARFPDQPKD
ncbi:MAG: phage tail assembly chaperone [Neomegalonema sp.]|nr:phage tail assembly chaperone [Neomegalonema sp.]